MILPQGLTGADGPAGKDGPPGELVSEVPIGPPRFLHGRLPLDVPH